MYPAYLALQRRNLDDWLRVSPFKEYLATRVVSGPTTFNLTSFGKPLEGIRRRGKKTLRTLLWFVVLRRFIDGAVHDEEQNRLLLAYCDGRREPKEDLLRETLGGMGWHLREE